MGADIPGAEVNNSGRCVQPPRIGVPLRYDRGMATVGSGEVLNGCARFGARDSFGFTSAEDIVRCYFTANFPSEIEHLYRVVDRPTLPVPCKPLAPGGDIAQIVAVKFAE